MSMQDNARPQFARIVQQYRQEVGIPTLVWPARNHDINPIEHVWDIVREDCDNYLTHQTHTTVSQTKWFL